MGHGHRLGVLIWKKKNDPDVLEEVAEGNNILEIFLIGYKKNGNTHIFRRLFETLRKIMNGPTDFHSEFWKTCFDQLTQPVSRGIACWRVEEYFHLLNLFERA